MKTILQKVSDYLREKKLTLSTAESCTGGLIGATFTDIPGSSEFYTGGVIAYDNRIKLSLLEIPEALLQQYGAVSSQTVIAMAQGVQKLCNTNCAVSTSGIAGPGGGTPDKPVGLVYIGIAVGENIQSFEYHFKGDRQAVREQTVEMVIVRLSEILLAIE